MATKTNNQLEMHYGQCPKKAESRNQTIIQTYRKHHNTNSIPQSSQYWSICGRCSYEENKLETNCEPDQVVNSGLIKSNQFHGIEIDQEIYNWNRRGNSEINWYLGDFYETMVEYANHNEFRPAIVNADLLRMPKFGGQYFARIMQFLSGVGGEVMLVGNFVMEHRQMRATIGDLVKRLEGESCFQYAMNNADWSWNPEFYWYNGTGKTSTKMMTVILFKGE